MKEFKLNLDSGILLRERATTEQDYINALFKLDEARKKASHAYSQNHYKLYYNRGICFMKTGQLENAEKDFNEALSHADDRGKTSLHILIGQCKIEMAEAQS